MLHFPSFLSGSKERRKLKKEEKEMSMRGWDEGDMSKPRMAHRRQMSFGIGHHFARNEGVTRSRGQKIG